MTQRRRPHRDVRPVWVPVTPAGTFCTWLAGRSEDEAWNKLLADAAHMPYPNKEAFVARGYTVQRWVAEEKAP